MLDLKWERYIPILDVSIDELKHIFAKFDNAIDIIKFNPIQLGCKNSNFIVSTNKGMYVLRIVNNTVLNNEFAAYDLVCNIINVPHLLFQRISHNKKIFIYQYIKGISLQKNIKKNIQFENYLLNKLEKLLLLFIIFQRKRSQSLNNGTYHLLKYGIKHF